MLNVKKVGTNALVVTDGLNSVYITEDLLRRHLIKVATGPPYYDNVESVYTLNTHKVGEILQLKYIVPNEDMTIMSDDVDRCVFQYYGGMWHFAGDEESLWPNKAYKILDIGKQS